MEVTQPQVQNRQHQAPATTDHAVAPPSGKSAGLNPGGIVGLGGSLPFSILFSKPFAL